jgi:hypothetical protein
MDPAPTSTPSNVSPHRTFSIVAFVFAFVMPLVGLILGIIATMRTKGSPDGTARGLSIAALIIGAVGTVLWIFYLLFFGLMLASYAGGI